MSQFDLHTKAGIEKEIRHHVEKILQTQDEDGMIPSMIEWTGREVQRKKDIPRQAMATMALFFANQLVPSLAVTKSLDLSLHYVLNNLDEEEELAKIYTFLYLALGAIYANTEPQLYITSFQRLLSAQLFSQPIAVNLYLRLSGLLPESLPQATYITEMMRYHLSLTPRSGRFFDYADVLVWGKELESGLAKREYDYLVDHLSNGWLWYEKHGPRATASVMGKIFEVFSYYEKNLEHSDELYNQIMSHTATSEYAKQTLGEYSSHILSEENTLVVDDAHMHVLAGLCYRYDRFSV